MGKFYLHILDWFLENDFQFLKYMDFRTGIRTTVPFSILSPKGYVNKTPSNNFPPDTVNNEPYWWQDGGTLLQMKILNSLKMFKIITPLSITYSQACLNLAMHVMKLIRYVELSSK